MNEGHKTSIFRSKTEHRAVSFAGFFIPPDVDLLYFNDAPAAANRTVVKLLRYLALNHERIVSKIELLETLWADVTTTEDVLKKAVSQARRVLGDDAVNPRFILNYHGRGYRFVAAVSFDSDAGEIEKVKPAAVAATAGGTTKDAVAVETLNFHQLVGRDGEMATLRSEYRQMLDGASQPIWITGDAGVGKTQLARFFVAWAREQGAQCAYTRFFDYEGSHLAPFEIFLDLLRDLVGARQENANGETDWFKAVEEICQVKLPDELLGGKTKTPGSPSSGRNDFQAITAICRCFLNLSQTRPLVLVFDDVQWADKAGKEILRHLSRLAADRSALQILLLARSFESALNCGEEKDVPLLSAARSLQLQPLTENACRQAVEGIFGGEENAPPIPAEDLATIYYLTGGNPYFLFETLRLLVAQDVIAGGGRRNDDDHRRWRWRGLKDVPLPDTIIAAIKLKLGLLTPATLELLEQAAVLGDEFRADTLGLMSENRFADDVLDKALDEAAVKSVISDRAVTTNEDFRFVHTIARRVIYENIPPRKRQKFHLRAAQSIEKIYTNSPHRVADAISIHYEIAREFNQTFRWSFRAAHAAEKRWQRSAAARNYERAEIAYSQITDIRPAEFEQYGRMLLDYIECLFVLGQTKAADAKLTETEPLIEKLNDSVLKAQMLVTKSRINNTLGNYAVSQTVVEEALAIYEDLDLKACAADKGWALMVLTNTLLGQGKYAEAVQTGERAIEVVAQVNALKANAQGLLGWVYSLVGRAAEGIALLEKANSYLTQTNSTPDLARNNYQLSDAYRLLGRYEKAVEKSRTALKLYTELNAPVMKYISEKSLATTLILQGAVTEGGDLVKQLLENTRETVASPHLRGEFYWLLGRACTELGMPTEADSYLQQAFDFIAKVNDLEELQGILIDSARLRIIEGKTAAALDSIAQAISMADSLQNPQGLGLALTERANVSISVEEFDAAVADGEKAVALLDQCQSGECWRARLALGRALRARGGSGSTDVEADLARAEKELKTAVRQLEAIRREAGDSGNERARARFWEITAVRSAPARELCKLLTGQRRAAEAETLAAEWRLEI